MKYRKKPVVIEAEQFAGSFPGAHIPAGVQVEYPNNELANPHAFIQTLEGKMTVSPGDWVITGVKGEKYPCKPDIFEATYEPA